MESIDTIIDRSKLENSTSVDLIDLINSSNIIPPNPTRNDQVNHQRVIRKLKSRNLIISPEIPGPTTLNQPRLLTDLEIKHILIGIPVPSKLDDKFKKLILNYDISPKTVYSSDSEISYLIYTQLYDKFYKMIEEVILTPSAIEDFKENVKQYINVSRFIPYTTVGLAAADSIASPLTQSTLNSFSNILGNTVSYSLDYMKEILDASKDRKQLSMNIHFNNKFLTYEEVLDYKNQIVTIFASDLVYDYKIAPVDELQDEDWYRILHMIEPIKTSSYGIRLYLDKNKLYSQKITMDMICDALVNSNEDVALLTVVPSPLHIGIIDIYPIENRIHEGFKKMENTINVTNSNSSVIFLNNIILRELDKVLVKGFFRVKKNKVKGKGSYAKISDLNPVESNIWNLVLSENQINSREYILYLNTNVMQIFNLGSDRIEQLLIYLNFKIIQTYPDKIIVQISTDAANNTAPSKYVSAKIESENERLTQIYSKQKEIFSADKNSKLIEYPNSQLISLYTYVYATTIGSALPEILSLDYVDADITITNDIQETIEVLGIEAARNLLVKEILVSITSNGSYIDSKHVVLVADYLTNTGGYVGFTYSGLANQDIAALDRTSFQRSFDVFNEYAVFGSSEKITSSTSSMFVGAQGKYGTGAPILEINNETRAKYLDYVKDKNFSTDDISDTIGNLSLGIDNERNDIDISELLGNNDIEGIEMPIISYPNQIETLTPNNVDRSEVQLNENKNVPEPKIYTGISQNVSRIAPAPVISNLFAASVQKIPGVPTLNLPEPIKIPAQNSELTFPKSQPGISFNLPPNTVPVENSNGTISAVKYNGFTESKNSVVPVVAKPKIQIKARAKINVPTTGINVPLIPIVPQVVPGIPMNIPMNIPGIPTGIKLPPNISVLIVPLVPSGNLLNSNNIKPLDVSGFMK